MLAFLVFQNCQPLDWKLHHRLAWISRMLTADLWTSQLLHSYDLISYTKSSPPLSLYIHLIDFFSGELWLIGVSSLIFTLSEDLFSGFQLHICISAQVSRASQKETILKMTRDLPHPSEWQLTLSSCSSHKSRSYSKQTLFPYVSKPMNHQSQEIIFLYNGKYKLFSQSPLINLVQVAVIYIQ